jgi:hypothetical protein
MSFAEAHPTEKDDIGGVLEKREPGEVLDLEAIDLFGPIPLELVEGFEDRKARPADAPVGSAILFACGLSGDEFAEIVHMGPVFFRCLLGHLRVVIEKKGELEVG